jgi:hypothetical protein
MTVRTARRLAGSLVVGCTLLGAGAHAADLTWSAQSRLENGSPGNCGIGQADWAVVMTSTELKYSSQSTNFSFNVSLKGLQANGSGTLAGRDHRNRDFTVTMEPGNGPRVFRVASLRTACAWIFIPKA